jgi:oxalate decarboxylase/phosphoglucose isomerase-like protein (cupin superfamily)
LKGLLEGQVADPELNFALKNAPTHLSRLELLPQDSDWTFDFTKQKKWTFDPGSVVIADAASFPAVTGHGMTISMLNLGPCSMLPPHLHPRGTNFVLALTGTTDTYMIQENHARTVKTTLDPMKLTIFPHGSIHWMENTGKHVLHSSS